MEKTPSKNQLYITSIFKEKISILFFIIGLIISGILIPKDVFMSWFTFLAILFIFSFALVFTCLIKIIRERIKNANVYGSSIVSAIAAILGLSALQVCGLGAPLCSATIGIAVLSVIFPGIFVHFLMDYSIIIIIFSILLNIISLFLLGCFKRVKI